MDLAGMTIDQLNALSEDLTAQRQIIREQQQELNRVRTQKLLDEQAWHWGLTAAEYADCKRAARDADEPLTVALNRARKAKGMSPYMVQGVSAVPVGKGKRKKE